MSKLLNDSKIKRSNNLDEMTKMLEKVVAENRSKNLTEEKRFYELQREISTLENVIERETKKEEENMRTGKENRTYVETDKKILNWLNDSIEGRTSENFKIELRADPILTTTDTGVINKVVENIDTIYAPSEELLKNLGVTIYTNVNGNLVLPSMSQDTAEWAGEDVSANSANMTTNSITLSAKRVTHTQSVSRETIAQSNNIVQSIVENLYAGLWNAVSDRLFDEIDTDAATQIKNIKGSTLTFEDITLMEASLGRVTLKRPAYVFAPETKSFCKKTASLTNQTAIWNNGVVNEYNAFSTPSVNGEKIYFGDWSKVVIAEFGQGIEIIVDPYSDAKKGLIKITAIGLFDMGVHNPRALCIIADASTY